MNNKKYGFGKIAAYSFNVAIEKVTVALQKEGFGVLSDIDVVAAIKKEIKPQNPFLSNPGGL